MTRHQRSVATLVAALLAVAPTFATEQPHSGLKTAVRGNSTFAFDLYAMLKQEEGNLFLSPYSISTALAMTYAGASGDTEAQMADVMHFTLPQNTLHPAFTDIQAALRDIQKTGNVMLAVANALWPQQGYRFRDAYLSRSKQHYGVAITPVDYKRAPETARNRINAWVEEKTQDKIRELIKPGILDAMTRLVLVNAIYFKGNWEHQFDKTRTRAMPFKVTPDKTIMIPMMFQHQTFGYYADQDLQVLEMPYIGKALSMFVLLPKQIDGITQIENTLTRQNLERWTSKLRKQKVDTRIPRFTMTSTFALHKALMAMGMTDAFGPKADFSGMDGTTSLYLSAVIHKAFVEVNEEGTEAAAATAVGISLTSARIPPRFHADHPFLFIIRDNKTGSILFMGRVLDPSKPAD